MKAHKRKKRTSILEVYRYNIIVSVILGLVIVTLCICICAMLVSVVDVSLGVINLLNSISLGIGSFVSGYVSAIKRQKSGILSGSLCGLLISVSIILVGIFTNVDGKALSRLCKVIIAMVCGAIGGIKSANSHSI